MKRLILLIAILCSFAFISCSSRGSGDEAPVIYNLSIFADPGDPYETTTYSIGDVVYLAFVVYDEDKDVESAVLSVKDAASLAVIEPETEIAMAEQSDKKSVYNYYFSPDEAGSFKLYLYVKDKAGNKSNILSKNITVN